MEISSCFPADERKACIRGRLALKTEPDLSRLVPCAGLRIRNSRTLDRLTERTNHVLPLFQDGGNF